MNLEKKKYFHLSFSIVKANIGNSHLAEFAYKSF